MSNTPHDPTDVGPAIDAGDVVVQGNFGGASKYIDAGTEARVMLALLGGDGERAQRILDGTDDRTPAMPRNTPHGLTQK